MSETSRTCERTRAWVSIALDEELSEFEHALLRAHLRRCTSCAAFSERIGAVTEALRAAPLQPVPFSISAPARRRIGRQLARVGAVAATIAVAVGLGTTLAQKSSNAAKARVFPVPAAVTMRDDQSFWSGGLPRVTRDRAPLGLGHRPSSDEL
jgi:anti-sigma factor RsiW